VDVTINPNGTTPIQALQSLLPGSLDVRSDPPGGAIWINNVNHGTTNSVVEGLQAETPLTVELRVRGRATESRTVTLRPREKSVLSFERTEPQHLTARLDLQPWDSLRGHRIDFSVNGTAVSARLVSGSLFELPLENSSQYNVHIEAAGFREQSVWVDPADTRPVRVNLQPSATGTSITSAPWPGEMPARTAIVTPSAPPVVNNPPPPTRRDIVPPDADDAGSIPLKSNLRGDQIINSIRAAAQSRGWSVARIENNVVVLTLKHHGYDATLYCRFDGNHIEFHSDSYRSGLIGNSAAKQVPTSWINNIKGDLTKVIGAKSR
jgi:hypothetical protein